MNVSQYLHFSKALAITKCCELTFDYFAQPPPPSFGGRGWEIFSKSERLLGAAAVAAVVAAAVVAVEAVGMDVAGDSKDLLIDLDAAMHSYT